MPKKGGKLQLCVDCRKLNAMTVKNWYPIPSINVLLDHLSEAGFFTKFDLHSAYYQICIAKGHKWKTAFRTCYRLIENLVMPFGLTNAPAAFQQIVNILLRNLIDIFVIVYLNNILIYSSTSQEEHNQHIIAVLKKLCKADLYVKATNCDSETNKIEYLGFNVTKNGIAMDQEKVQTVPKWQPPTTTKGV